ncbi:MAG: hypothetical protein ACKO96_14495 [Flammeovirgaceae bacterium]
MAPAVDEADPNVFVVDPDADTELEIEPKPDEIDPAVRLDPEDDLIRVDVPGVILFKEGLII